MNHNSPIPESVYEHLPPMLSDLTKCFNTNRERDMILLSSLGVVGQIFINVHGKYRRDRVHPNLFVLIGAPPASNKSVIGFSRKLYAPCCIASTAFGTLACPVTTITSLSGNDFLARARTSIPFTSLITRSVKMISNVSCSIR